MTERHLNYTKHILKNQGHYKTKFCNALDFLSCLKAVQTSKLKFQIINYLTLGYISIAVWEKPNNEYLFFM